MYKLLGNSLLNNTFVKHPNLDSWLKIDNVVLGNSFEFSYLLGNNKDCVSLLKQMYLDYKVAVVLYEWKTGNYYLKTGFDINDKNDYSLNKEFTAFIAQRNLLGTNLLGNTFVKDSNLDNWIKIDKIVIGNSYRFRYFSGNNKDCVSLLKSVSTDTKVVAVLYEWKTGNYYLKTGFDINNKNDYSINENFTTFILNNQNINVKPNINKSLKSKFVTWNGKNFIGSNGIFYLLGCNSNWMGQPIWNTNQQEEIFVIMQKMKGTTIRSHTLGFSTGLAYSLMENPDNWASIDNCFYLAKKYNIKLLCPLIDSYSGYGAGDYGDYSSAVGVDKSAFFYDVNARNKFKEFIKYWLNHINPLTCEAIKDSPELLMIEIGNEIGQYRPNVNSSAVPTEEWLNDISNYIKSIDQNHLVLCPTDETIGTSNEFNVKNLDCYSGHYYWKDSRLNDSIKKCNNIGKPYIIGEYDSKFDQDWYNNMYDKKIDGMIYWSQYCHNNGLNGGGKREWLDGFSLYFPEDKDQLLIISNYFRRVQGLPNIDWI